MTVKRLLLSPGETHLECWVQLWAPQYERDVDTVEKVQQSAKKIIKGLEHLSYEERLRAGTVQPGEEKAQRDLIHVYKYREGGHNEEEGDRLFSVLPTDRTRDSGHKLKNMTLHLNTRKHVFPLRVVKHRNRLPREVVKSPSVEILKT